METRLIMKRLTAFFACAVLAAMLVPALAQAREAQEAQGEAEDFTLAPGQTLEAQDDSAASGDWGSCVWTLDEQGTMTIQPGESGATGYAGNAPWKSHTDVKSIRFLTKDGAKVIAPTSCRSFFAGLQGLESVDFQGLDTSHVTDMSSMFSNCIVLKSVDLTGLDTSQVTTFSNMFNYCFKLESVNARGINTGNAKNMESMFSDCYALTSLDITGFDTSSVTSFYAMFARCRALEAIDISSLNTANATNMGGFFNGCESLKTLNTSTIDTSLATNIAGMFGNCTSLTSIDVTHFKTANVTSMLTMFQNDSNLTEIDVSHFDTSKVQMMNGMFQGCSSLKNIDVSNFNTEKTTRIDYLFAGCSSLKEIDLSNFNTANVSNMNNMFDGCTSLEKVDVSSFDTSHAQYMSAVFNACTSLREIDISNFNTRNATSSFSTSSMFSGCTALERITVGANVEKLFGFPAVNIEGHTDWYSTSESRWFSSYEISSGRKGIADTYQKWSDKIQDAQVAISDQRYTGEPVEPGFTVVMGEHALVEGVDYEIVGYSNNVEQGSEAVVTLRGIGEYAGEADFNFTISAATPTWTRLAGKTRYATMGLVAQQAFPGTCHWAVVVSGADKNFPDALSAAALAGGRNCPIITTAPDSLSSAARNELQRMEVRNVIIVGGTGAVSEQVESQLVAIVEARDGSVERIAGNTRYKTSQLVMEAAAKLRAPKTVFVSTGTEFADALSAGPWSYKNGAPIVLVNPKTGPTPEQANAIAATGAEKAVILGGKNAVPMTAEAVLASAGLSVERVSGSTRYQTSVALARWSMANDAELAASGPILATGQKSADALAGASLAAARNSVIVLADEKDAKGKARYADALALLEGEAAQLRDGYFLGGKNAVAPALAERVCDATHAEYREL